MELKKIIEEIKAERPEITSVIFVGCGASRQSFIRPSTS